MISEAIRLATQAHNGQRRAGKGEPYINHPARVAMAVSLHTPHDVLDDDMIAAAWLHDTLEDTSLREQEISNKCGFTVLELVKQLTFLPSPIVEYRDNKLAQNEHISRASYAAKIIKVHDRIDNITDFYNRWDSLHLYDTGDRERAKDRLHRYLDISWELVKLLSQQSKDLMDHDALTSLRIEVMDKARLSEFELR